MSSSAVRKALAAGDLHTVHSCLDRRHRVIAYIPNEDVTQSDSGLRCDMLCFCVHLNVRES